MKNKIVAAGLTAALVAGTGVGLLLEHGNSVGASSAAVSTDNSTGNTTGNTVTSTGKSITGTGSAERAARLQATLKPLVDAGTITQAQADAVVAAIDAAGPTGDGDHGGMPGMPGGRMGRMGRGGLDLTVVATTLGVSADDVRTAIEGGQTIAQFAVSKGKTAADVVAALVADATTQLDADVTAGRLTQAQADTELTQATTRITDVVNNTQTALPAGRGGMGPHGDGDGGPMDGPLGGGTTQTTGTTAG
jgi:hypothetical protein